MIGRLHLPARIAAICEKNATIFPAQIFERFPVTGDCACEDRFHFTGRGHDQHGLFRCSPEQVINAMKTVNDHLDLRRYGMVIKGRDKYDHIRLHQFWIQLVHRILKHTRSFSALADITPDAGMNAFVGCVKAKDCVPVFLCASDKRIRHPCGSAIFMRAPCDYYNIHTRIPPE